MSTGTTVSLSKTEHIALVGLLSAVNIVSRIYMTFLPNIKPVTSIIIISTFIFGISFALELTVTTTLVSDMFLGMGIWTIFQLLAWSTIVILTWLFTRVVNYKHLLTMSVFAACMGYVYGFVVSLEKLVVTGFYPFIAYYLAGLSFDTLHAAGNLVFYLICAPIIIKIFSKRAKSPAN